jgi:hypothetical protein
MEERVESARNSKIVADMSVTWPAILMMTVALLWLAVYY